MGSDIWETAISAGSEEIAPNITKRKNAERQSAMISSLVLIFLQHYTVYLYHTLSHADNLNR